MDEGILSRIFSVASGLWVIAAMLFVALFRAWPLILERLNERKRDSAMEKAGDWSRLRAEIDRLDGLLIECQKEKLGYMERAITAEATLLGYGNAQQEAARIVALERLTDAKKRDGFND